MDFGLDGLSPQFAKKMDKANSWLPIPLKVIVVKVKKGVEDYWDAGDCIDT